MTLLSNPMTTAHLPLILEMTRLDLVFEMFSDTNDAVRVARA